MQRFSVIATACLTISLSTALAPSALADVLFQGDSRDRFGEKGFEYFFIEAEDYHDNNPRLLGATWLPSSDPTSLSKTVNPLFEPDPGAYASGGESITNAVFQSTATNEVGGEHDVQYRLEFDTPGTYHLYIRQHSPLGPENDRNKNDSFYYPAEFGESPRQLKANGDDYGILESITTGDWFTRGPWLWFAARVFVENAEQDPPIDQDPFQFREYVVTDEMVGEELVLEFDHREDGAMLDAFLFIEADSGLPPTNGEGPDGLGFFGLDDEVDLEFGLRNLGSPVSFLRGDSNDDGVVDLSDAVSTLEWLFLGAAAPGCVVAANANGDEVVDVSDPVYSLWFSFVGGPAPPEPYPNCDTSDLPADEALGCGTEPQNCP